jgi:diazepam-binding inhibitor (GABA receptor modulating acyl-CoA-binding protein)
MQKIEETFNNTLNMIRNKEVLASKLSEEQKLVLYRYYKQATVGDCYVEEPDIMDYESYVKWKAWMSVKGTDKETAMKEYICHYNLLLQMYCLTTYFDSNHSL